MAKIVLGKRKEKQIDELKNKTDVMFDQVLKMFELTHLMYNEKSNEIALSILEEDRYLDTLQEELIIEISYFIVKEQPKATDLRICLAAYGMSNDIERIGDYLKSFAKMAIKGHTFREEDYAIITQMLDELILRIKDVRTAFMHSNHDLAKSVAKRDEEIDTLAKQLTSNINELLVAETDIEKVKTLTYLLMVARRCERAGDHIVNLCEQVSYIEKGKVYHYS